MPFTAFVRLDKQQHEYHGYPVPVPSNGDPDWGALVLDSSMFEPMNLNDGPHEDGEPNLLESHSLQVPSNLNPEPPFEILVCSNPEHPLGIWFGSSRRVKGSERSLLFRRLGTPPTVDGQTV